jgi:tRNA-Thr(GGU) m(6)t(6)A37 methyltransferase TsaA
MTFEPIGFLESCYPDKFGTPRQPGLAPSSKARLKILPQYQPQQALEGLSQFSHVWVIFIFHQNSNSRFHAKVHPPRLEGDSIGVFATRSPHRPNPIGLSLVELEKIEGDTLLLRGVDLVNGTPVLDIKPYLPAVEARPEALSGWTERMENRKIQVVFTDSQLEQLKRWSERLQEPRLRSLIEETLKLDPRPLVYRGFEGESESPYRSRHAVRFYDGDIHFHFISPEEIEILEIKYSQTQS